MDGMRPLFQSSLIERCPFNFDRRLVSDAPMRLHAAGRRGKSLETGAGRILVKEGEYWSRRKAPITRTNGAESSSRARQWPDWNRGAPGDRANGRDSRPQRSFTFESSESSGYDRGLRFDTHAMLVSAKLRRRDAGSGGLLPGARRLGFHNLCRFPRKTSTFIRSLRDV